MKFTKKMLGRTILSVMLVAALTACGSNDTGVQQPENAPAPTTSTAPATPAATTPATSETPAAPVAEAPTGDYKEMTQAQLLALYPDPEIKGTVNVGSSTMMNSDLFNGWTNITPNSRAKFLMFNDYSIVVTDPVEEFFVNNVVVENWESTDNADGTKTFTFKINENLVFNDGSPIDATNYAFTQMLMSSPEFKSIDGSAVYGINFVGYSEFNTGDTRTFVGIRLLDQYTVSFTVKSEELPYFYDKAFFINAYPMPLHVIAPDVTITDDGNGATISDNFTGDMLRETMLDGQTGYRYNPKVTPGAYQLESFDDASFTAVLTRNPNFLCLADGVKPAIEKIIISNTNQSTQMNALEVGQVDLIEGITTGTQIDAGLEMVDNGILQYHGYPRHGYGKIGIHCDFGPTQFEAVRQALCYLLDRDEFGRQYSGGYAIVVDSRYSESQWMYQERKDSLDTKLTKYTLNTDKANEILDEDGWVLDANGGAYVPGAGNIRHKDVDGELMSLTIEWCSSADNTVTDLLAVMLPPACEQVGMKLNQTVQDSVLDTYYRKNIDEPFFHIFNMGTGFGTPDAPWEAYSTKPEYWGAPYNQNFIANDILESATGSMKRTPAEDREAFLDSWEEYIVEWNKTLPDIPLYANIYHDFFSTRIEGYYSTPTWHWARNIPRCTVAE